MANASAPRKAWRSRIAIRSEAEGKGREAAWLGSPHFRGCPALARQVGGHDQPSTPGSGFLVIGARQDSLKHTARW